MSKPIAFVVSQFPEMHETFILREFLGFRQQGVDIRILSLKQCRDPIVHPEVEALMDRVTYSPFILSAQVLLAQLRFLAVAPLRYLGALAFILSRNWHSPMALLKSLVVFPKAVRFARMVQETGVSHLHAHWATIPTTVAMVISRLTGIPYSFTAHAWDIFLRNPMLPEKIRRSAFVVTCTGFNKRYMTSLSGASAAEKVVVNYHGIDLNEFSARENQTDSHRILSIGRLVEQKGFPYLLKAIRIARDRGHPVTCTIVGSGPLLRPLTRSIEELELGSHVEIVGPRSQEQIKSLFREAVLFALPCVVAKNGDRDGIPNVLIEAAALGVPMVSTSVSGIPELIVDGETGLLAPERDELAFAERIIQLLEDRTLRVRLATAARARAEKMFVLDRTVGQLVDQFKSFGALQ